MNAELGVRLRQAAEADVLEVHGVLTLRSAVELAKALRKSLFDRGHVLVDVSGLRVSWAPAVKTFPAALATAGGWPAARLVLYGASPAFADLLRVTATTTQVPVAATRAEATALLARRPPRVIRTSELPAATTAPFLARALVAVACEDWGLTALLQAAQVVASELVTIAVEDGTCPCTLRLVLDDRGLTIGDRDGSDDPPYRPDAPRLGLQVVDALSGGHHVTMHADGKTVWARVRPASPAYGEG